MKAATKNKGGRPRKKPGYDREAEIKKLIDRAVDLYSIPYDDREERPETAPTIESVAKEMGTTSVRVRKMLITAGYFSTVQSREVQRLTSAGLSVEQISEKTGLGLASIHSYLPYSKGTYKLEDPTLRAERGRLIRRRKRAVEALQREPGEKNLWLAIEAFEGYIFNNGDSKCQYRIEKDELVFSQIRISRVQLNAEYHRITSIKGAVDKTQCIECLYMVFTRLGVIKGAKIGAAERERRGKSAEKR